MFALRPANERGHTQTGWLDSWHTFSFGQYHDPRFMGFSDLRVINDDTIAPGEGFGTHPHDNMEIVSIVLNGELEHRDSMGNGTIIKNGEVQKMSAGSGITHSEFNPSAQKSVHFLQIWILPNILDIPPVYEQKAFSDQELADQLRLIVSPDGRDGSVIINQDAEIYQTVLGAEKRVSFTVDDQRSAWIHIAEGAVAINGHPLVAGDGIAVRDENLDIELRGIDRRSNVLVFNLRK